MSGQGSPARAHRSGADHAEAGYLSSFRQNEFEQSRFQGDEATPAILRLVKAYIDKDQDIALLSRRNGLPWYIRYDPELSGVPNGLERFCEHIRSFFPDIEPGRITASTVHRYKGREKEAVIVLGVDDRSYPLVHPSWIFLRLFGDSIHRIFEEEQKLFYVAVTRSQQCLTLLSTSPVNASPFLENVREQQTLNKVVWDELGPATKQVCDQVLVRVSNAYAVKALLKAEGFQWNHEEKYWSRIIALLQGANFDTLASKDWAQNGVKIKVFGADMTQLWSRNC